MAITGVIEGRQYVTSQPGGIHAIRDAAVHPGRVFWVGNNVTGATDSTGFGLDPVTPLATIDYAYNQCTTARGDTIYVLPYHSETKTTGAAVVTMDYADVAIIGIGTGSARPKIILDHADATISVTGVNNTLKNLWIESDVVDLVAAVTAAATADGLCIEDCYFTDGGLTEEMLIGISLAAGCDNCVIRNNRFWADVSADTGATTMAIKLAGESANTLIDGNWAYGHYATDVIDAQTALATNLRIVNNLLINIDSGAGLAYTGHAGTTGVLARNGMCGGKNNTQPVNQVTLMYAFENYGCDLPGTSCLVSPAVAAF